jgi:CXXX repeat modification system protein
MAKKNNEIILNNSIIKKEIGQVTPKERDIIKELFERKNGLIELTKSLVNINKKELENSYLYEKLTKDMGKVSTEFQGWWDKISKKYNWDNLPGYRWEIDFDTCKIYLVKQ